MTSESNIYLKAEVFRMQLEVISIKVMAMGSSLRSMTPLGRYLGRFPVPEKKKKFSSVQQTINPIRKLLAVNKI